MDKQLQAELLKNKNGLLSDVGKAQYAIKTTLEVDGKTAHVLAWDSVCAKRYPDQSADKIRKFVMSAQAAEARRAKKQPSPSKQTSNGHVEQPVLFDTDKSEIAEMEQQIEILKERIAKAKEKNALFSGNYIAVQNRALGNFRIRTRGKNTIHITQCETLAQANKLAASIERAVERFAIVANEEPNG